MHGVDENISPAEGKDVQQAECDGLAHLFLAKEGSLVPSTLAALKINFVVMEIPNNFLAPVNKILQKVR